MRKNKLRSGLLLLAIIIFMTSPVFADQRLEDIKTRSHACIVGDYETGIILEEYEADRPIEIASITKILSYLVIADEIKAGNIGLEDQIEIDLDMARVGGSTMKLKPGEVLRVEDLLKGLMVASANDATYALARYSYGTEEDFVKAMYEKAEDIGIREIELHNSTGLPLATESYDPENRIQNKMSPRDIFILVRHIIKEHPEALEMTSMKEFSMPERDFHCKNTNSLLSMSAQVDGFKTGYTDKAGYCLASTMRSGLRSGDRRLIAVVMGTANEHERSLVSKELLDYVSDKYTMKDLLDQDRPVESLRMKKVKDGYIKVYPKENLREIVEEGESLDMELEFEDRLKAPFKKGQVVGKAKVYRNHQLEDEVDLIVKEDIRKEGFFRRIFSGLWSIFKKK